MQVSPHDAASQFPTPNCPLELACDQSFLQGASVHSTAAELLHLPTSMGRQPGIGRLQSSSGPSEARDGFGDEALVDVALPSDFGRAEGDATSA
jgi:hypothetical protein